MSEPLRMLRLYPDLRRLAAWGHERGLVTRSGDLGYVLHAALKAALQDLAPKPFRLIETAPGRHAVLAYTEASAEALVARAVSAESDTESVLGLRTLESKPMPSRWPVGGRFRFELRARPVVRSGSDKNGEGARERDAFLHACHAARDTPVDRGTVYAVWLAEQLARHRGARLPQGKDGRPQALLRAFQRLRIARRGADRALREVDGPDAVLAGMLEVTDAEAFTELLRRGVGRHRAFGYGMLLLKPGGARGP